MNIWMLTKDAELESGSFVQVDEARGKKLIADGKAKGLEDFNANDPDCFPDTHPQYKIMHPAVIKPSVAPAVKGTGGAGDPHDAPAPPPAPAGDPAAEPKTRRRTTRKASK